MIASLSGTLKTKSPTTIVIDVNGVGYAVHIPVSTFEKLGEPGQPVSLRTVLLVRDDALLLFGFATEDELMMFQLLTTVSGIGPRTAQGILSGTSVADLKRFVQNADVAMLTQLPGIGKKTAERIIVELREKISKGKDEGLPTLHAETDSRVRSEAVLALASLGYSRSSAEKAIRDALAREPKAKLTLEELIKRALHTVSSKG